MLGEVREHGVDNARVDAGGGVVVEVDGRGCHFLLPANFANEYEWDADAHGLG